MEQAPYRADLAEGPEKVRAVWVTAEDDVQLRVAVWPSDGGAGTVLLLPGRTEYIEKYGRVARDLTARGYTVAAIDWRGQGFSDRLAHDRFLGHVLTFLDYQKDIAALMGVVETMGLPEPRVMLAHSMGGCIGLRALINGLPVRRAVFAAPMWGIEMRPRQQALAMLLPTLARMVGQGLRPTPGSRPVIYEVEIGFAHNPLTSDPDHFALLSRQIAAEDHFALGAPSLHWLGEALGECRRLAALPRPDVPVLSGVGTEESVVSTSAIVKMHSGWRRAQLNFYADARHELLMERPEIRSAFLNDAFDFLSESA